MAERASGPIYTLSALRAVALHTQRLTAPNGASPTPTPDAIANLVSALGYVQIDTLSVVNRAHHVALWARLGSYDLDAFDRLIYTSGERRLYEGWGHAASIISLEDYRYHRWRTDPATSFNPTFRGWLSKDGNRELAEEVLARIRSAGGLRVGDFDYDGPQRGAWYDWNPPKMALEMLFARGDLMVTDRVAFQRVYDVSERVMPAWVDTTPVPAETARRVCLEQAARALGVFELRNLTFYAYMRATPVRQEIRALVSDGTLVGVQGESMQGDRTWMVHRDTLPLLQRAADGEITARRTTFLSPFDSLFWAQGRDEMLWGFRQVLEAYKPAKDRVYGYLCFPILHRDRLVGRLDPKLERESGVLHLKALYLEPGIEPDDALVAGVATAMGDFVAWQGASDLKVERSDPAGFGERLRHAISDDLAA
jgi:uncharacterized protein